MGVTEQKEGGGSELLGKEEVLPQAKEALEIVGRREAEADRNEKCFKKQVDQEIQGKNDVDEISPDKVESENVWEESEREGLGRVLVASRHILPWEQVAIVTMKNYCGSDKVCRWLRTRHLCWLLQTGWFVSPVFTPCPTNLTPALPVPGLSVARPVQAPSLPATMGLSAGCLRRPASNRLTLLTSTLSSV